MARITFMARMVLIVDNPLKTVNDPDKLYELLKVEVVV